MDELQEKHGECCALERKLAAARRVRDELIVRQLADGKSRYGIAKHLKLTPRAVRKIEERTTIA